MSRNTQRQAERKNLTLRWFADAGNARRAASLTLLAASANSLLWPDWRGLTAGVGAAALVLIFTLARRATEPQPAPVEARRRLD